MGLKTLGSGGSSSSYQALADTYNMSPGSASPSLASVGGDWQQHNQYQQLLNQQALLNQLQSKMQLGQVIFSPKCLNALLCPSWSIVPFQGSLSRPLQKGQRLLDDAI